MTNRDRKQTESLFTPSGEKHYPTIQDERRHDLACAIIEQAVYDWIGLDYGRLGYMVARNSNSLVYRAEVKAFFKGKWFETLLSYALPDFTPADFRREMRIE